MRRSPDFQDPKAIAAQIDAEIRAFPVRNAPNVRTIQLEFSRTLRGADPEFVLELAHERVENYGYREIPYELIQ